MTLRLGAVCLALVCAAGCATAAGGDPRFATAEATLATYVEAQRRGDRAAVEECFYTAGRFYLPGPAPIERYSVRRRTVLDRSAAGARNTPGAWPKARPGDVELIVEERVGGRDETYWYALRLDDTGWKIYAHSSEDGGL